MAWNEQKARDRVAANDFHDYEIDVADLKRVMDFHKLGRKDVRRADGAHVYEDIPNFHEAVAEAGGNQQKLKKIIRAASVLRRVESDLEREFEVGHLQFQAARLHGLVYTPYDDEADRAVNAVKFAITVNTYVHDVFNDVFIGVTDFAVASGIAAGRSLLANVGHHGERELIALGTCANVAAKMLSTGDTITIAKDVYDVLGHTLQERFKRDRMVAGVQTYQASGLRWTVFPELADVLDVDFNPEKWRKKTIKYRDALPLNEIELTEAQTRIDLGQLTERNSKRTSTVAIYADLDGFTKLVQEAEGDEAVVSLVRKLNMIRAEFHAVAKSDYPGVVLQHQGDRMFAIVHLPPGDKLTKRCQKGLDVAIGIQSSMVHVLKEKLGEAKEVKVAIGLDVGTAIVTRLGKRGEREPVCLGCRVSNAEDLQLASSGRQIRMSESIYEQIDDEVVRDEFKKQDDGNYVATGLTFPRIDEKKENQAARGGSLGAAASGPLIKVTREVELRAAPRGNRRPWHRERLA